MRKNLKNMQFLPLPVVVIGTYDESGKPNAMTAAWSTIYDFGQIYVSLGKHKTTKNLEINKCFTLAFATQDTIKISDYFGIVSGNDEDKVAKSKIHVSKAKFINAPIFEEYPLILECEVISFNDGNLIGKVVNTSIDEKYLNNNKIDFEKMKIVCYDMSSQSYRLIDKKVATAFKIGLDFKK